MIPLDSLRGPHRAQQFSTVEMVKALDRHPAARRPYRRLFDRATRGDEPGIHGRRGACVSRGRRERGGGGRNIRLSKGKMKRILLLATAALAALTISVNARDDRLPAKFVGDWCLAEHTADHLSFYRRGRCTSPDGVDDWLTISPDRFDAHEMRCMVLVAHPNKRGDYLVKVRCDDNLIQNYWFSLFNDRLYVSL